MKIEKAQREDLGRIYEIQKASFKSEAEIYSNYEISPLLMSFEELQKDFEKYIYLKAFSGNNIIGSVKLRIDGKIGYIGNLIVDPDFQNQGIGSSLAKKAISLQSSVERIELFTGHRSSKNIYLYKKLGFEIIRETVISDNDLKVVIMELKL